MVDRSRWYRLASACLVAGLLVGCSRSGGVPVPSASEGGSPPSSTTAAGRACAAEDLQLSAGPVDAGAGQRYVPIVFHNRGPAACLLRGYPGVAGLDAAGAQVTQARREPGPAAPAVRLEPGADASAVVHAGAVPSGSDVCPPDYAGLLVTPPDLTVSVRVSVSLPACAGLSVRPVVAGTTGVTGGG